MEHFSEYASGEIDQKTLIKALVIKFDQTNFPVKYEKVSVKLLNYLRTMTAMPMKALHADKLTYKHILLQQNI
jgi:hypothetical protein